MKQQYVRFPWGQIVRKENVKKILAGLPGVKIGKLMAEKEKKK